jgi:LDH2 family malate/lactate/ureidoglycolate dehydrogenase
MNLAVDKCLTTGVAVVAVFNSHHFGAAGCYAKIAADRGVIGMVTSATRGVTMVPTFAAEPVMGTNPLAFAAPAKKNASFELDMATTTVAAGKVKVYKLNHKPVPSGWVVDGDGRPVTDEATAFQHVFERRTAASPLGGSHELGGPHATARGAGAHPGQRARGRVLRRCATRRSATRSTLSATFMAIDPGAFRDAGDFGATGRRDRRAARGQTRTKQPVMAGDPSGSRAEASAGRWS